MATHNYKPLNSITVSDIQAVGLPSQVAEDLHQKLTNILRNHGADTPATWHHISTRLLNPDLPFSFHQMLYYGCFKDFGADPPAWLPDPEAAKLRNVGRLLERHGVEFLGSRYKDPVSSFSDFQEFSVSNPEVYWKTVLDEMGIMFSEPPQCILRVNPHEEGSNPGGQWLPGASVNPAKHCLSINSERGLDDVVIRWRDEGDDDVPVKSMTLEELRGKVWLVAHALDTLGLDRESAIAIDMPMNVNSVVIYVAIVLAGYVIVSIADSFAAVEISTRI